MHTPRPNALGLDITALSGIKRLYLSLASCEFEPTQDYCHNLEGLLKLLGSMNSLQFLYLDLPYMSYSVIFYQYDQVFIQAMTWNSLDKLTCKAFSGSPHLLL